jgi:hypothetical protein
MNPLLTFYNDKHMKEAVEALFVDTLKELAVTKAFKGESNVGIAEAKVVIDYSFAKLENMFAPKKKIVRRVIK